MTTLTNLKRPDIVNPAHAHSWNKTGELLHNIVFNSGVLRMPAICSRLDDLTEERWPRCAVRADRGKPGCVWWWGLECVVLTSGCHVVISRRYHTRRAQMHIDPGTWVQPVNGVIFILLSPLLLLPPAISHFLSSLSLIPSSSLCLPLVSPPLPVLLFVVLPLSSVSHLFCFPLPSLHPPSWIKLFIWPKPQPAGKQAVSTEAEQRTKSFKQHYIGLAWSMSHTDRWKHWPLRHRLYMDMMKCEEGSPSVSKLCASLKYCYNTPWDVRQSKGFVEIRKRCTFVFWSNGETKQSVSGRKMHVLLAAILLDHLLQNQSGVNLV